MFQDFGRGALVEFTDKRDYQAAPILAASLPVDWLNPGPVPVIPIKDQKSSDACVSFAWSYYHEYIQPFHNFSRRALFSRIAQSYGAYIRDGGVTIVKIGQETELEVPDPVNPTPVNMRDGTGTNSDLASDDKAISSYSLPNDVESVAKCARDFKGSVFGITADDSFFTDVENPPVPSSPKWGHALYVPENGYHLHNGKRCILAQPSWAIGRQYFHHINEDFFNKGFTFNPWTLIPRKECILIKRVKKLDNKTFGVLIDTPNGAQIIYATGEDQWRSWNKVDSYVLPTVNSDGTTNWDVDYQLPF